MPLVQISSDLAVDSDTVKTLETSGDNVTVTQAFPASTKESTAANMDVQDVFDKLKRGTN